MKKKKTGDGLTRVGDLLPKPLSKRSMRKVELIEIVNEKRSAGVQDLGYSSRPFVLCGLPIKRPAPGVRDFVRRNGDFTLEVSGHKDYGLPFGQDRLVPIWIATLAIRQKSRTVRFKSAAEMLTELGLSKGGYSYRRLIEGFQRIATSQIHFGTDKTVRSRAWEWRQFRFFDSARLWSARGADDTDQIQLPGEEFENTIVLSEEFWNEINQHPIPVDFAAVRALVDSPAALDLYIWLVWRSFNAKNTARIPLFGDRGLVHQLGSAEYSRERAFREKLKGWLQRVKLCWPGCNASLSEDGATLLVRPGRAIHPRRAVTKPVE